MKVLVVGPDGLLEKMEETLRRNFVGLEIIPVKYRSYWDTPAMLESYRNKIDGVLFAGKSPFKLCESKVGFFVPCEYVPRHESTLLKTLLRINCTMKKSLKGISMDTYDQENMRRACDEIGIKVNPDANFFARQEYLEKDYTEKLIAFHRKNYYEKRASVCITGFAEVETVLSAEGIPSTQAQPTDDLIIQSMKNLQMRHEASKNSENQIVVIAISLQIPSEYSVVKDEEYFYLSRRIKILDKIYAFNNLISGVVVEDGRNEFMIFTTRKIIQVETGNYSNIYLLDMLKEVSTFAVSMGIGYGSTAADSKFNAYMGIRLASQYGKNAAFIVFENGDKMGPLEGKHIQEIPLNLEESLYKVSEDVGISVNMTYKILNSILKTNKHEFTSKELANICGISVRSMDRVVTKFCDAGYCQVVGERLLSQYGRPSRILRFNTTGL